MGEHVQNHLQNPPLMAQDENGQWREIISAQRLTEILGITQQALSIAHKTEMDFPPVAVRLLGKNAFYWKDDVIAEVERRKNQVPRRGRPRRSPLEMKVG